MEVKLLRAMERDWIGVYVDGKLINEGHSLRPREVLEAVGVKYEEVEVDFEMAPFGSRCPEDYSEVEMALVSIGVGRV